MSDWIAVSENMPESTTSALTGWRVYIVMNTDTKEVHTVTAFTEEGAIEKAERGDFDD